MSEELEADLQAAGLMAILNNAKHIAKALGLSQDFVEDQMIAGQAYGKFIEERLAATIDLQAEMAKNFAAPLQILDDTLEIEPKPESWRDKPPLL